MESSVLFPLNGYISNRQCMVQCPDGEIVIEGQDNSDRCPLDNFLKMILMEHMENIVQMTNHNLHSEGNIGTSAGEILRFFDVIVLMTRF